MTVLEEARRRVQPISPRYARYDARVRFLGRMLSFLRRHKVLFAVVACVLLAALILFLAQIGSFFNEAQCADFLYGDAPACNAQAFLAPVHYEYAEPDGTAQWQKTLPSAPGQYRIRGVSKNAFGIEKYSNEMTFTLLPRELRQVLPQDGIRYGDLNTDILFERTKFEGLASGDQIHTAGWNIQVLDGPAARVSLEEIEIRNEAGKDVTACYRILAPEESITLLPRPIVVQTESLIKDYDGIPYTPTYSITAGDLVAGDQLEVVYAEILAVDTGVYLYRPTCTVRNSTGLDVSHYYKITEQSGTLTVNPRPITIQTGSAEKVYDGKFLECNEWSSLPAVYWKAIPWKLPSPTATIR